MNGPADGLPPLSAVIARYGLSARKGLGQNFILDLNLTGRIARSAGPLAGFTVIEVGPGPGGLTRGLLAAGAERVVAIERDQRCLPALDDIAQAYPERLTVVAGDALTTDFAALVDGPVRIVANLPYNIATPLLVRWLQTEPWPPYYASLTLMFQREVAERIVAGAGDRAYGRLGVFAGWRTEARILFDVPPRAFTPPPAVVSSVVELIPRAEPLEADTTLMERVAASAFGQRRKMLRQSLKSLGGNTTALLAEVGIDETRRAEEIGIDGFAALARALAERTQPQD